MSFREEFRQNWLPNLTFWLLSLLIFRQQLQSWVVGSAKWSRRLGARFFTSLFALPGRLLGWLRHRVPRRAPGNVVSLAARAAGRGSSSASLTTGPAPATVAYMTGLSVSQSTAYVAAAPEPLPPGTIGAHAMANQWAQWVAADREAHRAALATIHSTMPRNVVLLSSAPAA